TPLAHAGISSIDLAYEKMGQQAVQQMLGLIAQRNQMTGSIQLIPPGLHIRQSTWRTNIGWRLKSH
ncbi:MAG: substrate-binding domain-containing protein, partial [Saprospiraceae bacterium]|nr:substrate-binding domain-containing protein [Saprospiraceae bacterium]